MFWTAWLTTKPLWFIWTNHCILLILICNGCFEWHDVLQKAGKTIFLLKLAAQTPDDDFLVAARGITSFNSEEHTDHLKRGKIVKNIITKEPIHDICYLQTTGLCYWCTGAMNEQMVNRALCSKLIPYPGPVFNKPTCWHNDEISTGVSIGAQDGKFTEQSQNLTETIGQQLS